MITIRKTSYRVRLHRHGVPDPEEIGEMQILAALIGVAEIPRLAQRLMSLRLPALVKSPSREAEAGLPPPLQKRLGLRSALVVPLAARGRFLGILWLDDTRAPHLFTS